MDSTQVSDANAQYQKSKIPYRLIGSDQERTRSSKETVWPKRPVVIVFCLVFLVLVAVALFTTRTMAESPESAELEVLQGNGQFTNNMYQILAETDGNVFFSPVSAHAVLSMAFQGAQGTTLKAFADTLQVAETKTAAEGYKEIMTRLNNIQNVTLLMANKVFLKEGHKMLANFQSRVTDLFLSEVQQLDFGKNEAAAKTINAWVEEQTRNKIKDLIKKDDLDELTRLVLVNAIYFKGNWLEQFDKEQTKTEKFYLNDKDTVDVQMMHVKKSFSYKVDEKLNAQVLELPYTNRDLSMIIILPNDRNGIRDLEQKLATTDLTKITEGMWRTEVNVALPKFKIETTIDLKDTLTRMGLGEIFDQDKANFRGMIELQPNENLYVSKVIQKAFIEVNEEGAEAAAATGFHAVSKRSLNFPEDFVADRPFVYVLTARTSAERDLSVLFYGKLAKPNRQMVMTLGHDEL